MAGVHITVTIKLQPISTIVVAGGRLHLLQVESLGADY